MQSREAPYVVPGTLILGYYFKGSKSIIQLSAKHEGGYRIWSAVNYIPSLVDDVKDDFRCDILIIQERRDYYVTPIPGSMQNYS